MEGEHEPLTRRTTFRLGGAVALLAAAGLAGRAVLARHDVDEYRAENERYFAAVNENPSNYHRNPTVEDAVAESDAVIVGEIVEVKQLGSTFGETPDQVSPAYGYVVRVIDVLHGSLPIDDRERLTVLVHDEMIGELREPALQLATAPRGLATWILRSNRSEAEQTKSEHNLRLQDGRTAQLAAFLDWYAPTYTPAGGVQGVLMQGRHHVQSPLDDDPTTAVAADAARYGRVSELNAAIEKMA